MPWQGGKGRGGWHLAQPPKTEQSLAPNVLHPLHPPYCSSKGLGAAATAQRCRFVLQWPSRGGSVFGYPLPREQGQILAAAWGTLVPRTGPGGWQHPAGSLPGALWHLRAQNCCTTDPKSRHQSLGHLLGVRGLSSAVALRSASPLLAALLAALPKPAGSQRCLAACSERASLGHGDVPGVKQPSRDRRGSDGRRKRFRVSSSVLN